MNRREYLEAVAGMPLLPTVSISDVSDSVNYTYLDSLFDSEYIIGKNPSGSLGKTYASTYEESNYTVQYRAYSNHQNVVDVYDYSVPGCTLEVYRYIPENHYEAWTLTEIGRKQDLDDILSVLEKLELKHDGVPV